MSEQQTAEPEVMSEDDVLGAAFDKLQEADETPEAEVDEAPEPEQAEEEPEAEEPDDEGEERSEDDEIPSDLPKEVREVWADLTPKAREAVVASQRSLSNKLREQGNLVRGIEPIRDVLVEAAKQMPALADMKPQEVAREVMELARVSNEFSQKPVETLMGWIRKHGLEQQIGQALQGQPVDNSTSELKNTITKLERKIQELSDPEARSEWVSDAITQRDTIRDVNEFARSKDDWAEVEPVLPAFVQAVQARNHSMGKNQTPVEVLEAAYALAKGQVPEAGIPQATPSQDVAQVDPQRTEAAKKAKSVKVTSRSSGKARTLSEDELLSQTFDRLQAS